MYEALSGCENSIMPAEYPECVTCNWEGIKKTFSEDTSVAY